MVTLIVSIILLGLLYWVVSLIPLPSPFPRVVQVLFIILLVLMLLNAFGVSTGLPSAFPRLDN